MGVPRAALFPFFFLVVKRKIKKGALGNEGIPPTLLGNQPKTQTGTGHSGFFFPGVFFFFKDVAENVTLSAQKNPSNPIVTALLGKS